ncbi:hypothetical protein SODALDRAFT_326022 [Sodiomyces alkalinus F11]|uniref:G-patch domain-containing protein n=1 Tax=Sodiomyces alkalinus (strain CBS 110278 / VKM F-3762 / F11) TaxID=1314773 RepID=A0A3N2Q561_SODAK|nr:hypothetical protein SODALDRAFT_326022 [Sodiomyces alkalinus F11]ROT41836.1 hypothetical protein SODALDRAFT_326022 [Sodiomyces alkalinus F11]
MADEYGEDYDVPLQHKRPFGAGIRRKKVEFVRASDHDLKTLPDTRPASSGASVADMYLSLVLPEDKNGESREGAQQKGPSETPVCTVCKLPLEKESTAGKERDLGINARQRHEASIAHQVCLEHSHPPSALDRSRMGLNYLSSYGWDPDARRGLGPSGQGIQFPLKPKPKDDTLGLGLKVPKDLRGRIEKKKQPERLDAKKSRQVAEADRQKGEKLREMFYGNYDVAKYLGSGS